MQQVYDWFAESLGLKKKLIWKRKLGRQKENKFQKLFNLNLISYLL